MLELNPSLSDNVVYDREYKHWNDRIKPFNDAHVLDLLYLPICRDDPHSQRPL
mgnify:CR=1 FL=1